MALSLSFALESLTSSVINGGGSDAATAAMRLGGLRSSASASETIAATAAARLGGLRQALTGAETISSTAAARLGGLRQAVTAAQGPPTAGLVADFNADTAPNSGGVVTGDTVDAVGGLLLHAVSSPSFTANVLNGHAECGTDGSASYFSNTTLALAQPFSAFLVWKQVAWVSSGRILGMSSAGPAYLIVDEAPISPYVDLFAGSLAGIDEDDVLGTHYTSEYHFAGAASKIYQNSTLIGTGNPGTTNIVSGFRIGSDPQSSVLAKLSWLRLLFYNTSAGGYSQANINAFLRSTYATW